MSRMLPLLAAALVGAAPLVAQTTHPHSADTTTCSACAEWNIPVEPFKLHGNAYYVGPRGLSAILLVSDSGHILLDAALPQSAPNIMRSIRALGFRVEDVRLIVNTHAHDDHAGGIAEVQRVSGAAVAARAAQASVLERGSSAPDDPQYGELRAFPPVSDVRRIDDGDTLRVGPIAIVAHATAGHTPGGTTWTWRSCEGERCLDFVYADSQTPMSASGFRFTASPTYPQALQDFESGLARIETLSCDVLLTPHPGASAMWQRIEARPGRPAEALRDRDACRRYAAGAREQLARRVAQEAQR